MERALEIIKEAKQVIHRKDGEKILCPTCKSGEIDTELHDFSNNKTFCDIMFCRDCGELFKVITPSVDTKRKEEEK